MSAGEEFGGNRFFVLADRVKAGGPETLTEEEMAELQGYIAAIVAAFGPMVKAIQEAFTNIADSLLKAWESIPIADREWMLSIARNLQADERADLTITPALLTDAIMGGASPQHAAINLHEVAIADLNKQRATVEFMGQPALNSQYRPNRGVDYR